MKFCYKWFQTILMLKLISIINVCMRACVRACIQDESVKILQIYISENKVF